jgi:hypothetical protein
MTILMIILAEAALCSAGAWFWDAPPDPWAEYFENR